MNVIQHRPKCKACNKPLPLGENFDGRCFNCETLWIARQDPHELFNTREAIKRRLREKFGH